MTEEWRPVAGWEGSYEVSNRGGVRSVPRVRPGRPWGSTQVLMTMKGRALRPAPGATGHLQVNLSNGHRRVMARVHRLVLEAFAGPCPDGMEGCHNNGDPSDNRVENLRWDTRSANAIDKVRHGNHPGASKTECKHGHAFDEINTYVSRRGKRVCRRCRDTRKAQERARKRTSA